MTTDKDLMDTYMSMALELEKDLGRLLDARLTAHFATAALIACAVFEKRIRELEKGLFKFDGSHESGKTYSEGRLVTHAGSIWRATYTTASEPGNGPAWTHLETLGKDAR